MSLHTLESPLVDDVKALDFRFSNKLEIIRVLSSTVNSRVFAQIRTLKLKISLTMHDINEIRVKK